MTQLSVDGSPRSCFNRGSLKAYLFFLLLISMLYLPFIDKAYHIDDFEYINISGMIGWNPLHAAPVDYPYDGMLQRGALVPYEITHPLIVPYLIKVFSALFGQDEVRLHLSFMIFVVMALVSLIVISQVLFREAKGSGRISAFFLLTTPAFLVNSQNLMTDVPTLALLLCSIACYVRFAEKGSILPAYIGGIFLTLAAFTSYQAIFFSAILFAYLSAERKINIHTVISLALPGTMLMVWFLLVYRTHGILPFFSKVGEQSVNVGYVAAGLRPEELGIKLVSLLAFTGSSVLFLIPAYCLLTGKFFKFLTILLPSFIVLFFTIPFAADYPMGSRSFLALLAALGSSTFIETLLMCLYGFRNGGFKGWPVLLAVWIVGGVVYTTAIYPWMAARHVLPLLPPVLMILSGNIVRSSGIGKRKVVVAVAVSLSVLFGMASAYSDYKYADTYREFARSVEQPASKGKVWFMGRWGMVHYMQKVGGRYLFANDNTPVRGDIVVIPEMPGAWDISPALQDRLVPFARREAVSPLPLRLFNGRSRAGFYCTNWGLLPFAISREPDEVFSLLGVL